MHKCAAGQLDLVDSGGPEERGLVWKWLKGEATSPLAPGNPVSTDAHALCMYVGTASLVVQADAPAGGTCAGEVCWAATEDGYLYKDRRRTPNGMFFSCAISLADIRYGR